MSVTRYTFDLYPGDGYDYRTAAEIRGGRDGLTSRVDVTIHSRGLFLSEVPNHGVFATVAHHWLTAATAITTEDDPTMLARTIVFTGPNRPAAVFPWHWGNVVRVEPRPTPTPTRKTAGGITR